MGTSTAAQQSEVGWFFLFKLQYSQVLLSAVWIQHVLKIQIENQKLPDAGVRKPAAQRPPSWSGFLWTSSWCIIRNQNVRSISQNKISRTNSFLWLGQATWWRSPSLEQSIWKPDKYNGMRNLPGILWLQQNPERFYKTFCILRCSTFLQNLVPPERFWPSLFTHLFIGGLNHFRLSISKQISNSEYHMKYF